MNKTPIIIFGNSEMARLLFFYFNTDSNYEVCAFTVDRSFIKNPNFCGLPLLPYEELENTHPPSKYKLFIAIGYSKLNNLRKEKFISAKNKGYQLVSYISSKATIMNEFIIGENCLILENNVIQPFVKIGDNVFLWSGNHIGHGSSIHNHVYIASHVVISGNVEIGHECFIGVNATIRDNVKIGDRCIIGAGCLILKDAESNGIYSTDAAVRSNVLSSRFKGI